MSKEISLGQSRRTQRIVLRVQNNFLLLSTGFVFVWLAVWLLAYLADYVHHASVWFPPAGLTFAGLLVVGKRIIPALVVCAIVSTLWTAPLYQLDMGISDLIIPGILFAFTHITPYFVATYLLKRVADNQVHQLPELALLFLVFAIFSSLVATFAVLYGLAVTDMMAFADIRTAWLPFWVGDMAGIIALAPLFMGILNRFYPTPQFWIGELREIDGINSSNSYTVKLVLSCLLLTASMLLAFSIHGKESYFAVFIIMIPIMWIAYTESPFRTAMTVALLSFYLSFLVDILGLKEFVIIYQFAICIMSASALFYLSIPSLLAHNQSLRYRAITDNLTEVASRDHLCKMAESEIQRCHANQNPLSVMIFDVDNFKTINDTLGHAYGDRALVSICQVSRSFLRRTDILGRLGGDEFVVVMPNARLCEIREKAEQIRQRIRFIQLDDERSLSCSFGLSQLRPGENFTQVLERADSALYLAKNGGRNKVCDDGSQAVTVSR